MKQVHFHRQLATWQPPRQKVAYFHTAPPAPALQGRFFEILCATLQPKYRLDSRPNKRGPVLSHTDINREDQYLQSVRDDQLARQPG